MSNLKNKRGQGLVEYIILITLMGIALIAVVRSLKTKTHGKFNDAVTEISAL